MASDAAVPHFDVIILGAGLSGIGAAYHLQANCPQKSYAILESRAALGGTWDLFRYPGVRSDSDMYTLGYGFRPWRNPKAIADGAAILRYLRDTATVYGIDRHVRFGHRVESATWSTADARWLIEAETDNGRVRFTCGFLFSCTGYYDCDAGYSPAFPGRDRFRGPIVHPQAWPRSLDWTGKHVVVIGSGATAVTLVPALAKAAATVTMLQRSPTYVVSRSSTDAFASRLRRLVPDRLAYALARWRNVLLGMVFYRLARSMPAAFKSRLLTMVRDELGPDYDVATHFTPRYDPWDQRLCLDPDGEMFAALRSGKARAVTDTIETFTETGLALQSGARLDADIVVTATGLTLKFLGGIRLVVDGTPVDAAKTTSYKGMMFSGIPNLASTMGYPNASWTLKSDLTGAYVCRLLNHMDRRGYTACTPRQPDPSLPREPLLNFTSGYVLRSIASFPSQGTKAPWKLRQNYLLDRLGLTFGALEDGTLSFTRSGIPRDDRSIAAGQQR